MRTRSRVDLALINYAALCSKEVHNNKYGNVDHIIVRSMRVEYVRGHFNTIHVHYSFDSFNAISIECSIYRYP